MNLDPYKPRGTSAIGFGDPSLLADRINAWTGPPKKGHEIATHYLCHFCGSVASIQGIPPRLDQRDQPVQHLREQVDEVQPAVHRWRRPIALRRQRDQGRRTPYLEDNGQMYPAMVCCRIHL